jgi:Ca2+/Na+ antiporter
MSIATLFGNLIVLIGMAAAIYYLVVTHRVSQVTPPPDGVTEHFLHIIRRRRFGAALMILIAITFLIATNWYMDVKTPGMTIFWLLLMLMLLWLLILATLDIREVKKLRQQIMKQNYERFKTTLDDFKKNTTKHSDSGDKKNDKDDNTPSE